MIKCDINIQISKSGDTSISKQLLFEDINIVEIVDIESDGNHGNDINPKSERMMMRPSLNHFDGCLMFVEDNLDRIAMNK